jgi:hypothetical protein
VFNDGVQGLCQELAKVLVAEKIASSGIETCPEIQEVKMVGIWAAHESTCVWTFLVGYLAKLLADALRSQA